MAEEQYTSRQHFIPRYSIKPFQQPEGNVLVVEQLKDKIKLTTRSITKVMQKENLYEFRNQTGRFVLRNDMENKFSDFENEIAPKYKEFVDAIDDENRAQTYKKWLSNGRWGELDCALLKHIGFLLIKSPKLQSATENINIKIGLNPQWNEVLRATMLYGSGVGKKLKQEFTIVENEDLIDSFLRDKPDNLLEIIFDHLVNNYRIRVYKAPAHSKFILGDNPVLISQFDDVNYLLPVSPNTCVGTVKLDVVNGSVTTDENLFGLTSDQVCQINKLTISGAHNAVIVQNKNDFDFVKTIREGLK